MLFTPRTAPRGRVSARYRRLEQAGTSAGTSVATLRGFPSVGPAATKKSRLLWVMHVPALQRKIREKASHAWDASACITPDESPRRTVLKATRKPGVRYPGPSQPRSQREKPRSMLPLGQRALSPERTWMAMLIITTSKSPNVFIPGKTEKQRVSICHQPSLAKTQHPTYFFESRLA